MKAHALFPTLVCEFEYPKPKEFKKFFVRDIWNHMDPNGYSMEYTGHLSIHHEDSFYPLFTYITVCVKQYMDKLNIDYNLFDINIVKTWMNITSTRSTPTHTHADAHIAFTYYVHMPDEVPKPIQFYNHTNRYEPYPGACKFNNTKNEWDEFNSYAWKFWPKEGDIFVFPANLPHDTVSETQVEETGVLNVDDMMKKRVCLAGDIVITYKQNTAQPMGLQPISNWRNFSS